jgi:hypothetical protein
MKIATAENPTDMLTKPDSVLKLRIAMITFRDIGMEEMSWGNLQCALDEIQLKVGPNSFFNYFSSSHMFFHFFYFKEKFWAGLLFAYWRRHSYSIFLKG